MLFGFTQSFYFLYKRAPNVEHEMKYQSYGTTWMALFHMTLGDYDVSILTYIWKTNLVKVDQKNYITH